MFSVRSLSAAFVLGEPWTVTHDSDEGRTLVRGAFENSSFPTKLGKIESAAPMSCEGTNKVLSNATKELLKTLSIKNLQ